VEITIDQHEDLSVAETAFQTGLDRRPIFPPFSRQKQAFRPRILKNKKNNSDIIKYTDAYEGYFIGYLLSARVILWQ
jgi:hypothetical protein